MLPKHLVMRFGNTGRIWLRARDLQSEGARGGEVCFRLASCSLPGAGEVERLSEIAQALASRVSHRDLRHLSHPGVKIY